MSAVRAFVAASIDSTLGKALDDLIGELQPSWPEARWVPAVNRHLTLKFLGQIELASLELLSTELGTVARSLAPLSVPVTHIGPFPANARSHIVAAHLAKSDELQHVADGLDSLAAGFGLGKRQRPFRPHITLGRMLHRPDTGEAVLTAPFEGTLTIANIGLYRSDTIVDGRAYTELDQFALANV